MKQPAARRGFSLAEVLVATVLLGVIGGALTRMVVDQMRFFDNVSAVRGARSVARNAVNVILADLRMVQDQNGVSAASTSSITVRVPYRFGVFCGSTASVTTVSMFPIDSVMASFAVYAGYGWRDRTAGTYTVVSNTTAPVTSAAPTLCTTTAAINTMTINNRVGGVFDIVPIIVSTKTRGSAVFWYQTITYSFASSTLYPGKIGLWRSVLNGVNEELMAPFATGSGFKFYLSGADASTSTVPADLNTITGIDLVLNGLGPRTPAGKSAPPQQNMVTSVFFKNVR